VKNVKIKPDIRHFTALAFTAAVLVGSFFWPAAGLAVPVLVLAAALGNMFKPRWFCAKACPRAYILGGFLPRISRYRPLPKSFYSPGIRKILCGFMLFCSIGQTVRVWPDYRALGFFFWYVCALTLAAAFIVGILYKPRAWCAFCPVGTLQDTMRGK